MPGEQAEVDYIKQTQVETKTASLIQRVIKHNARTKPKMQQVLRLSPPF